MLTGSHCPVNSVRGILSIVNILSTHSMKRAYVEFLGRNVPISRYGIEQQRRVQRGLRVLRFFYRPGILADGLVSCVCRSRGSGITRGALLRAAALLEASIQHSPGRPSRRAHPHRARFA